MELSQDILNYLKESEGELFELLEALSKIPAPSHHEERRAEFIKTWLDGVGAKGVYIDEAKNVVCPTFCEGKDKITVFMAHTDTVFPDTEYPMPYSTDGKYIYSPGVGDDTVCVAMMLMIIKYAVENRLFSDKGVLFVANSCEEGLGNLKGVKQIMKDYEGRVEKLYTFDGMYNELICRPVGSHRYKITLSTEGGHSFCDFGNRNAICAAAELICKLDKCSVPSAPDSKTTYNVGLIEGGTSVNTIAQRASFLYEFRSDDYGCLKKMEEFFESCIAEAKKDSRTEISVELLGVRPCGNNVNEEMLGQMIAEAKAVCEKYSGIECRLDSGSTDANIPMSLGIPAVCVGVYLGGGVHTREEFLEIASVPTGFKIAAELVLKNFHN